LHPGYPPHRPPSPSARSRTTCHVRPPQPRIRPQGQQIQPQRRRIRRRRAGQRAGKDTGCTEVSCTPDIPPTRPLTVCSQPHDVPRHPSNPPPRRSLPTATPKRHVTAERARVRHVTAADDPHPPPHHPNAVRTPRHGRQRPPHAASWPTTNAPATSPPRTTPTSHNGCLSPPRGM
jgi:hypothetical protein